jgi:hypothetical protein
MVSNKTMDPTRNWRIENKIKTYTRSLDLRVCFFFGVWAAVWSWLGVWVPEEGFSSVMVTAQTCLLNSSALLSSIADIELRPWWKKRWKSSPWWLCWTWNMAISVQYSQYVVSRRVAFLVLIWRLGSVGVEIDRRATNKQLKALTQLTWTEEKVKCFVIGCRQ